MTFPKFSTQGRQNLAMTGISPTSSAHYTVRSAFDIPCVEYKNDIVHAHSNIEMCDLHLSQNSRGSRPRRAEDRKKLGGLSKVRSDFNPAGALTLLKDQICGFMHEPDNPHFDKSEIHTTYVSPVSFYLQNIKWEQLIHVGTLNI